MVRLKRWFYILLFNILVSAATTLTVLYFWERAHPPAQPIVTVINLINPTLAITETVSQPSPSIHQNTLDITSSTGETNISSETPAYLVQYTVKKDDTLGKIALAFDVRLDDLMRINGLTDPDLIAVGQVLYIPSGPLPTLTPPPSSTPEPSSTPVPGTPTRAATATEIITAEPPIPRIESITGAGNLELERVKIGRSGRGELSLAGWQLEDEDNHIFTFPNLILNEGGVITVHSKRGSNTVTDLYWGFSQPIWKPGETAILRDEKGIERARFRVP